MAKGEDCSCSSVGGGGSLQRSEARPGQATPPNSLQSVQSGKEMGSVVLAGLDKDFTGHLVHCLSLVPKAPLSPESRIHVTELF